MPLNTGDDRIPKLWDLTGQLITVSLISAWFPYMKATMSAQTDGACVSTAVCETSLQQVKGSPK
jgi:hypothetical protein